MEVFVVYVVATVSVLESGKYAPSLETTIPLAIQIHSAQSSSQSPVTLLSSAAHIVLEGDRWNVRRFFLGYDEIQWWRI